MSENSASIFRIQSPSGFQVPLRWKTMIMMITGTEVALALFPALLEVFSDVDCAHPQSLRIQCYLHDGGRMRQLM